MFTPQTVVMMHIFIIFKHEISRKKIRGKEENNCTRKLSNVCNIISIFDSFRVCVNSERILLKRRQFVIFKTAYYSIKQRSTTLVVLLL